MNLIKNLRANTINSKITFAFFTLTSLIIALEVLAYVWINEMAVINDLKESSAHLKELQMQMKSASNEFILREKTNENFFASGKSVYLNRYSDFLNQIQKEINLMQNNSTSLSTHDNQELDTLKIAIQAHSIVFQQMVEKLKTRGYGRYGIIGEFDKAIEQLMQYNFGENNKAVVNLQLFVKNYLLTGDEKLAENISNEVFNFTMAMESHIRDEDVEKVSEILLNYETIFKKLTQIDAELGIYTGAGLQKKLFAAIDDLDKATELKNINAIINSAYANNLFKLYLSFFLVIGVAVVAAITINRRLHKMLVQPIHQMKSIIAAMSLGQVPKSSTQFKIDDLNEMSIALNNLVAGIRNYQEFANNIGKGNLDTKFTPLSEHDILGKALLTMRQNLKTNSEEDKKRSWASQGLAELSTLLRTRNKTNTDIHNVILQFVVKYTDSNQGSLFRLTNENGEESMLDLIACYAWEKRKYINKKIPVGNGLVGQCALEKRFFYITDLPKNYITITSGLGEANPNSLLIAPLLLDEQVVGVIELASFKKFEKHQIDFVIKFTEAIAGSIHVETTF